MRFWDGIVKTPSCRTDPVHFARRRAAIIVALSGITDMVKQASTWSSKLLH